MRRRLCATVVAMFRAIGNTRRRHHYTATQRRPPRFFQSQAERVPDPIRTPPYPVFCRSAGICLQENQAGQAHGERLVFDRSSLRKLLGGPGDPAADSWDGPAVMSELQVNAKDKLEPVARVDPNATTDLPDGGNVSGSNEHILHNAGKIRPPVRIGSSHLLPLGSASGPEASSRSRGEFTIQVHRS
jgi:hypothetical protein